MKNLFLLIAVSSVMAGSSAFAASLIEAKVCSDQDIYERVCGTTGDLSETKDSTGLGLTSPQLAANERAYRRIGKPLFSPQAEQRFESAVQLILTTYKELASEVPAEFRDTYNKRLAEFDIPKYSDMKHTLRKSLEYWLGRNTLNAFYDPKTETVTVYPSLLNDPNMSYWELVAVLAHEIGHHMDGRLSHNYTREGVIGKPASACFDKSMPNGQGNAEDFADWMSSLVLAKNIAKIADLEDRQTSARNALKFHCGGINGEGADTHIDGDPHSASSTRITNIFRQPELLKAIGCSAHTSSDDSKTLACNLSGEEK